MIASKGMSEQILASIDQNISKGIAARSFFQMQAEMHTEIAAKIDNQHYTNVYNLLSGALQSELLLCVTRIWDEHTDTFSFPNLARNTDWNTLKTSLEGDKFQGVRENAVGGFLEIVSEFLGNDLHSAIQVSRIEGIAHSVGSSKARKKMLEPRFAKIGELYVALDISVEAFNKASLAIMSSTTSFDLIADDFSRYSRQFLDSLPDLNAK